MFSFSVDESNSLTALKVPREFTHEKQEHELKSKLSHKKDIATAVSEALTQETLWLSLCMYINPFIGEDDVIGFSLFWSALLRNLPLLSPSLMSIQNGISKVPVIDGNCLDPPR